MDFLSIILAVFGWQKDHSNRISDRRIEASRLNAEVAAETLGCISLITGATPGILRRLAQFFPDQSPTYQSWAQALANMQTQAEQLYAMTEANKKVIESASAWGDWDKLVRQLHEWRATATTLRPYNETIIKRFEDVLASAEGQVPPSPSQVAPKDSGWDASPL